MGFVVPLFRKCVGNGGRRVLFGVPPGELNHCGRFHSGHLAIDPASPHFVGLALELEFVSHFGTDISLHEPLGH